MFEEDFDFENRIVTAEYDSNQDYEVENSLRPKTLSEYVGQEKAKSNLKVYIESAKLRAEAAAISPHGCTGFLKGRTAILPGLSGGCAIILWKLRAHCSCTVRQTEASQPKIMGEN